MTSIRTGLLGLVALLALVGPASASATAVWQHEGAPLTEHAEVGLEGSQIFVTEAGAMICQSSATLTIEPGSTGVVTEFTTSKCQGLFGELKECLATSGEQLAGPWDVHVTTTDLDVTEAALVPHSRRGRLPGENDRIEHPRTHNNSRGTGGDR